MARSKHWRMLCYGMGKIRVCYCCDCQGPNEGTRQLRKRARRRGKQEIEEQLKFDGPSTTTT